MKTKDRPHYVNNADFSKAVVEYVTSVNEAKAAGESEPVVTDYIAKCFLKIAEQLSHKSNFARYTYREEMVMDAVENCLRAIRNYDVDAATRSGKPNAFAYFTQICWYAFLRRISKEKKQQDVKMNFLSQSILDNFIVEGEDDEVTQIVNSFVEDLRKRIDEVKERDGQVAEYAEKSTRKRTIKTDSSNLDSFMDE